MKQIVTILSNGNVTVKAGIMPMGSKSWNEGIDDKDRYKQIPLELTFDLSGVIGDTTLTTVSPLLERAMDGYFIDAREPIKRSATVDMTGKTNDEKYEKLEEIAKTASGNIITLPVRIGRKPGELSLRESNVIMQETRIKDIIAIHVRFADKMKPTALSSIIEKAMDIDASDWLSKRGEIEAQLINASK